MTLERLNYSDNFQTFIDTIKDSFVECIYFNVDTNPTFDKKAVPFHFLYCYSVSIVSDKGNFDIHTAMTDSGVETFWILPSKEVKTSSNFFQVYSKVISLDTKTGYDDYPFKIKLEFEKNKVLLYCGELYDKIDGEIDYKINDEMILAFQNEIDAQEFERIINYG